MAAMEGMVGAQDQGQPQAAKVVERLNSAVQQQLNLESIKTRAISLFKAISRILEDLDAIARTNSVPKWQDVLGQFSMVNLELYSIVEDIKKVSKAFVVHPKNVNAENATSMNTFSHFIRHIDTNICGVPRLMDPTKGFLQKLPINNIEWNQCLESSKNHLNS